MTVLVIGGALLIGVLLDYLIPENVFLLIVSIATFATVWVWLMILLSQVAMRRNMNSVPLKSSWQHCQAATMAGGRYSTIEDAAPVTLAERIEWIGPRAELQADRQRPTVVNCQADVRSFGRVRDAMGGGLPCRCQRVSAVFLRSTHG